MASDAWTERAPRLNSQNAIYGLAVYNDKLYGSTSSGGRLFEWDDVDEWVQVAPAILSTLHIFDLIVYDDGGGDALYGAADIGRMFQWNDSNAWVDVSGAVGEQLYSLAEYGGELYAGTGANGKLFKWNDVDTFTEVAGKLGTETRIQRMLEYNGALYGGTWPNGLLYEWDDVSAWVEVAPELVVATLAITDLVVFDDGGGDALYGSTHNAGNLQKWNDVDAWVEVAPDRDSQSSTFSLAVYQGSIYAGTSPAGKLFRWNGTNAFEVVAEQLNSQTEIFSLVPYKGLLYGGTRANPTGGRLFEFGEVPRARIMGGGNFNAKKKPQHLPPSTAPELLLHNTTEEDGDGGRESVIRGKGEQTGGELTTLGKIEFSHDGAADDEKGQIKEYTNDGSDGDTPTLRRTVGSAGNTQIGDGGVTNYTNIAADGSITLLGTARTTADLPFSLTRLKKGGISDPGEGVVGITYVLLFDKNADEEAFGIIEIPHNYVGGTDIDVHFHWSPADADAGDVTWGLEYHITRPETNDVLTQATTTAIVVDATQSLQDEDLESGNITISGSGVIAEDLIHFRIFRDADASEGGASDTYDDDAQLHKVDFEYIIGSL